MNEADINSSIGQIIEPDPIKYSFNTPGWYLVLALLVLFILIIAFLRYRRYKKNAYRREALSRLSEMVQEDRATLAFEINKLMKILSIQLFGREKVASLIGEPWFSFLNKTMNSKKNTNFEVFTKAIYNSDYTLSETEKTALVAFATCWIKNHDRKNV